MTNAVNYKSVRAIVMSLCVSTAVANHTAAQEPSKRVPFGQMLDQVEDGPATIATTPAAEPAPNYAYGEPDHTRFPGQGFILSEDNPLSEIPGLAEMQLSEEQFGALLGSIERVSPEKVKQLYAVFQRMQAVNQMQEVPPQLKNRPITVSLTPSGAAPIIYIAAGYPTALTFKDIGGAAWPVTQVKADSMFFGGDGATPPVNTPNVYLTPEVTETGRVINGSIMVEMLDMNFPLVFDVRNAVPDSQGRRVSDGRLEITIPRMGPNARPEELIDSAAFHAGDTTVRRFLLGDIPDGAVDMEVRPKSQSLRAWKYGDHVYLKTSGQMIIPEPIAAERSSSGQSVFRLPDVPRAVISVDGVKVNLVIRERRYVSGQ